MKRRIKSILITVLLSISLLATNVMPAFAADPDDWGAEAKPASEEVIAADSSTGVTKIAGKELTSEESKAAKNKTTSYGCTYYLGVADGINKSMSELQLYLKGEEAMDRGGTYIGCHRLGGGKGTAAWSGDLGSGIHNALFALNSSSSVAEWMSVYVTYFHGNADTVNAILKDIAAGGTGSVPVLIAVPAFGIGDDLVDLYNLGLPTVARPASNDTIRAISAQVNEKIGTTMLGGMMLGDGIKAGASVVMITGSANQYTGNMPIVKYALPVLSVENTTENILRGWATPKLASTLWAVKPVQVGTYNVTIEIGEPGLQASPDGYINIVGQTNFASGIGPNPVLAGACYEAKVDPKWTSAKYAAYGCQVTVSPSTFNIKIPSWLAQEWNSGSGITYKVNVTGGTDTRTEQSRPFTVHATVNGVDCIVGTSSDSGWKAFGSGTGTTYTSWYGDKISTDDTPYDWHTVGVPQGEGEIVANEVNNEDWSVGVGIPSTENTSIKVGQTAAMVDVIGWLCARGQEQGSSVGNQSSMGEDQVGVTQASQVVNRTIELQAQITNCWGGSNYTCQLTTHNISDSGGESKSDSTHHTEGSHSCSWSCAHTSGSHSHYDHINMDIPQWRCGIHSSVGWNECDANIGHSHGSCGAIVGYDADNSPISCGSQDGCSCPSPHNDNHNCTWSYNIQDAVGDHWLGQSGSVPDSGSIDGTVSPGGSLNHPLLQISLGGDCGVAVKYHLDWHPSQDRQFYVVNYSLTHENRTSTSHGCTAVGSQTGQSDWRDVSGTVTPDQVFCNDYTHGTGGSATHYENVAHPGKHTYTITYHETIDAYVYRTITSADVYALAGMVVDSLHQINRPYYKDMAGIEYEAGTFCAPLDEGAIGQGVGAPSAVGYMWRCCGTNHGEYTSGKSSSRSGAGRIEFEAWKEREAKLGGGSNVTISFDNTEYYLGDVKVTIKAVQDSEWGGHITGASTWDANSIAGKTNRGEEMHLNPHGNSTTDYYTTASDTKYKNGPVGDSTHTYQTHGDTYVSQHNDRVATEIEALINYWEGKNKDDNYHANIISDTMAYGGVALSNNLLDDAYTVDEGVPLFNVHAKRQTYSSSPDINEDKEDSRSIYRNHKSKYGINNTSLIQQLKGEALSSATVHDGTQLEMFGGASSYHQGGTAAVTDFSVGVLKTGNIAELKGKGCMTTKGDAPTSAVYSRPLPPTASANAPNSGITTMTVTSSGSVFVDSRQTYWELHTYENKGSSSIQIKVTPSGTGSGGGGYNNNGDASISNYGTLVISNLQLVDWTPNGTWNTGMVGSRFVQASMCSAEVPEDGTKGWALNKGVMETHEKVAAGDIIAPCGAAGSPYLNQIWIYDPVSTVYDKEIGAQWGKFEGTGGPLDAVTDDTMYDQRVLQTPVTFNGVTYPIGTLYVDMPTEWYKAQEPYVVQSQYLWTWISPFGNFASVGGCGDANTANTDKSDMINGGTHQDDGSHNGYVDKMQIGKWLGAAGMAYPFIVGGSDNVSHTYERYQEVPIRAMKMAHSGNELGGGKLGGYAPGNILPSEYLWGNAFGVTNTCNLVEKKDAQYYVYAYGINPFIKTSDSETVGDCTGGYYEQPDNNTNRIANKTVSVLDIDLVGSIGNVTIHDVTDFRFSNFFKQPASPLKYLIDGVIYEVDMTKPVKVVSSWKDIELVEVKDRIYNTGQGLGHATLGLDVYNYEDTQYGGMAGAYTILPLKPKDNTVDQYKADALRLGYKAYISVDTIGNYQSKIDPTKVSPTGPGGTDTRENYLEVKSVYYLYDLDNGKFYDIDLWSGSTGSKERLYNGTSHEAQTIGVTGAIYQNVLEEKDRRNIGKTELLTTDGLAVKVDTEGSDKLEPTIIYSDMHYIGTPGKLRLDNRDLTYIGSSNNFSIDRYWGKYTNAVNEPSNNAQRYHFMNGLTSTTFATEPLGANPTQVEIQSASGKVMKDHPHSVIIEFQDYIAHGTIWTIRCRGSQVNYPEFDIYDLSGGGKYIPVGWNVSTITAGNKCRYQGANVYSLTTGSVIGKVDPDLTPVVVQEAFKSAAEDRNTAGTH